jgi:hypothetical protein
MTPSWDAINSHGVIYDLRSLVNRHPNGGVANTFPVTFTPTFNQHISEFKVGINYKFGSGVW